MAAAAIVCAFLSPLAIWLIAWWKDCPKWLKIILWILQLLLFVVVFATAMDWI